MKTKRLAFIGAGNMAEALCRGIISSGLMHPENIIASDISEARRNLFEKELGARTTSDNRSAVAGADIVLLSVKPQIMDAVLAGIGDLLTPDRLIISIAAGIKSERIEKEAQIGCRVVRAMPNTPLLVGCGMTALCVGSNASPKDLETAESLFRCAGKIARVEESQIDAVTAVSGSGPAYFFYMAEAIIEAGIAEGLEPDIAAMLTAQTMLGAGKLLAELKESPAELRRKVTSPNGTTEAAVKILDDAEVAGAITRAARRAAERSRELSAE